MKKDNYTVICKLCSKDISFEYMGFGALKQHSEKQKHRGLPNIDPAGEGQSKQSVLSQYFVKTSSIYSCQGHLQAFMMMCHLLNSQLLKQK